MPTDVPVNKLHNLNTLSNKTLLASSEGYFYFVFLEMKSDFFSLSKGVHCTHGFNRTGFLIIAYLVERDDWR